MIWATDDRGNVRYVGPEWHFLTGQERPAAEGWGWLAKVHPIDRGPVERLFRFALAKASDFSMSFRVQTAGRRYIRVLSGAVPSFTPVTGAFLGYLGSITVVSASESETDIVQVSGFSLPPSGETTLPATIDLVADHLLLAHALSVEMGDAGLQNAIQVVLYQIGRLLAKGSSFC